MRRRRKKDIKYSVHSKLSYFLLLLAMVIQFFIGFRHIGDADPIGRQFGTLTIVEGIFAMFGLFLIDPINSLGLRVKPKPETYRKVGMYSLLSLTVALILNMLIQVVSKTTLTIRDEEMALAIIFCAPAEEAFFRGFLMTLFMKGDQEFSKGFKDIPKVKLSRKKELSMFIIFAILIDAMMFALLHVNYYDQLDLMFIVFFGGAVYAFVYFIWEDLTGVMLAHLIINVIAVWQMFWMVSL